MFEQGLVPDSSSRRGWSFAGSATLQAVALGAALLLPLVNTYEIDLAAWARSTFYLAAPPPPAPPAPAVQPAPQREVTRFEADFRAPSVIPDQVAYLQDTGAPVSPIAAMQASPGVPGGVGAPSVAGVLGMFPTDGAGLAPPPPVRVGGNVQNARLTHRVLPVYPQEAVEQFVSGTVRLRAIIAVDGRVKDLELISGHPMLASAAIDAVSQWRYKPTQLNGQNVEVLTVIDVNFNLTLPEEDPKQRRRAARKAQRRP